LRTLILAALVLLLAGGCTASATYRMRSDIALKDSLDQVEKGMNESVASAYGRMGLERDNLWAAYQVDLVKATAKPPAEVPAELARLAGIYRTEEAVIAASRVVVDTRAGRVAEHIRFMRETLADRYGLEEGNLSIQQKLERYRVTAVEYARTKYGLGPPPEIPPESILALPTAAEKAPAPKPAPAK
jgi:hypothetical protein